MAGRTGAWKVPIRVTRFDFRRVRHRPADFVTANAPGFNQDLRPTASAVRSLHWRLPAMTSWVIEARQTSAGQQ